MRKRRKMMNKPDRSVPDYHDFPGEWIHHNGLRLSQPSDRRVRTKWSHPYSYDPIVQYQNSALGATGTIYTDRMLQWDYERHNALANKHFGNEGQRWDIRPVEQVRDFLRDWVGDQSLEIVLIEEQCNQATGYPAWRIDFHVLSPSV
jgi:hypothetical protein